MTRGVRLYLVGSFVLVSLAGCGRGFFQSAEREPWRAEAEVACLKSGAVKESAELVRIEPDFRSRRLRRGISAQGRSARRKHRQLRFCRRKSAAAREYRQSAALAGYAPPAAAAPGNYQELSGNYPETSELSGTRRAAPAELCARRPTGRFHSPRPASPPQEDDIDLPARRRAAIARPRGADIGRTVLSAARPLPGAFAAPYSQPSYSQPPAAAPPAAARARAGQFRQRGSGRSR